MTPFFHTKTNHLFLLFLDPAIDSHVRSIIFSCVLAYLATCHAYTLGHTFITCKEDTNALRNIKQQPPIKIRVKVLGKCKNLRLRLGSRLQNKATGRSGCRQPHQHYFH